MRSTFRHLLLALAIPLALSASAQYPYTLIVEGTVSGCTPGQQVTIATTGGTTPSYTYTLDINPVTCTYDTMLNISSGVASVVVTTMCSGMVLTAMDSAIFNFLLDTVTVVLDFNCGPPAADCLGVPGGPNVPGSPCNDGNPATMNDTWDASCNCVGSVISTCQAAFTINQIGPWAMQATATPLGTGPFTFNWWLPDGSASVLPNPIVTLPTPGVYGICLTIVDATSCTSTMCDTLVVDTLGNISTSGWVDCQGVLWGPAMPGTSCDDGDPNTVGDTWTPLCTCVGSATGVDCMGIPGGTNLPGTACVDSIGGMILTGIWSATCQCVTTGLPDCLGIPGGPNLPGTPCNDGSPATVNDMWDVSCNCVGTVPVPCEAEFVVIQAFTVDSLTGTVTPIPNLVWVWNLSTGGTGTFQYLWNFGDGSSSTQAYPTHSYATGGPYNLCLTITDNAGCTDTYCDSVSVDANGIYNGMATVGLRSSGFTVNVMDPAGMAIPQRPELQGVRAWPNPVQDELTITFDSPVAGTTNILLLDLGGRLVWQETRTISSGANRLQMNTSALGAGMYLLRVGNTNVGQRVVKMN